jgi:hypothetical protein
VIITNHSVTSNDHGQHQATALMVVEAFDAAADPNKFPEQLKDGVTTWQVQRLFVRMRGNQASAADAQIVTVDPNERDPVRGVVYAEEALRALQKHATQGPWPKTFAEFAARFRAFSGQSAAPGQLPLIRYRLVREAKGADALPDTSQNFLDGLHLPGNTDKRLAVATLDGQPLTTFVDQRQSLLSQLVSLHRSLMAGRSNDEVEKGLIDDSARRVQRLVNELNDAIAVSAGIRSQIVLHDQVLIPGQPAHLSFVISNRSNRDLHVNLPFEGMSQTRNVAMLCCADFPRDLVVSAGKTVDVPITFVTPASAKFSVPHAEHLYDANQSRMNIAVGPLTQFEGAGISLLAYTSADVAPPVDIENIVPAPVVLTPQTTGKPITFAVRVANNQTEPFKGTLSAQSQKITLDLPRQTLKELSFRIPNGLRSQTSELTFTVRGSAAESVTVSVRFADAKVSANLRVGYIRGFDFSLPNALAALGVESKELTIDEVKTADLQKLSTIIVDNRVYESQPELITVNQKLLDFANAGGTLIVFYHKSDEWNPDARRNRPQLAPYKLILGNERITDENAPVTFLEPDHPLLNVPNKLNQDDFKDWIQERGLYYPREWDPQFHALLQSNDPGEAPLKGGLLVADYGHGHYIYSSMVWYRQLRAGVPGAYRMLANMISYGRR